jgi:hypothetical protein
MEPTPSQSETIGFPNRGEKIISAICFLAFEYLCSRIQTDYDVPADIAIMIFILPLPFWFIAMTNNQQDCKKVRTVEDIEAQNILKFAEDALPTYKTVMEEEGRRVDGRIEFSKQGLTGVGCKE